MASPSEEPTLEMKQKLTNENPETNKQTKNKQKIKTLKKEGNFSDFC